MVILAHRLRRSYPRTVAALAATSAITLLAGIALFVT